MMDWLYDTLLWTGLLIGLVLVLRRPVARFFGPKVAYALWAIPFIRLILPPVVLPAWMGPASSELAAPPPSASASGIDPAMPALFEQATLAEGPQQVAAQAPLIDPIVLTGITLALWLGGAAVFLVLRFRGYWQMRETMLRDAREVGRSGNVRLVETPAATAPLAFGVRDKIVALPPGFLAMHDRTTRDLAVAHELAHHHGRDLLVNIVMQPLFAMHWFNPLAHFGWQALRRDQEAACDARVIERHSDDKRIEYARVIASFAAGPNVALAAPMACPILGEKSVIERLRSLKMSQHSTRRQKSGRALLLAALIAVPLTATVSYAEGQSVEDAFADEPPAPPAPSVPPAPPTVPDAPEAPPAPPTPPAPPEVGPDDAVWHEIDEKRTEDGKVTRAEKVFVIKGGEKMSVEERNEVLREMREARIEAEHAREEAQRESRHAFAEARREVRMARLEAANARTAAEHASQEVRLEFLSEDDGRTIVEMKCEGDEAATTKTRQDGTNVVMICQSKIMAEALAGLKEARAEIARNTEMDSETRAEVLRSLDEQIRNWNKRG